MDLNRTPDEFGLETGSIGSVLKLSFYLYKEHPNPSLYATWASILVLTALGSESDSKFNRFGPPPWLGLPCWSSKVVAKGEDVKEILLDVLHLPGSCSNLGQDPKGEY